MTQVCPKDFISAKTIGTFLGAVTIFLIVVVVCT